MKLKYEIRGNLLLITEYPLHLYYKLRDVFTYKKIGYDRQASRRTVTPEIVASGYDASGNVVDLSSTAIPKQIISFHNYEDRLLEFVIQNKLEIDKTESKLTDAEVFEPQWDNVPDDFEFRYMQREIIQKISVSTGGIFLAPPGFGKLMSNDTPTLTPTGWKLHGDLKVGDKVIGRNGKATNILSVHPQPKQAFYKITFSDGTSVKCGGPHKWTVKDIFRQVTINGKKQPSIRTVTTQELYSSKLCSNLKTDKNTKRTSVQWRFYIPMCEPVQFSLRAKPLIDPWVLGVLLGDGRLKQEISFCNTEDDIVRRMCTYFNKHGGNVVPYLPNYSYRLKQTKSNSVDFYTILQNYNLRVNTEDKFIPDDYKFGSIKTRIDLIRGLVDTDGFIRAGSQIQFSTINKRLADDVKFIVQSLGGTAVLAIYPAHKQERANGRIINCQTLYELNIKCNELLISSKKHVTKWRGNKIKPHRQVRSVELIENQAGQCITVEDPEQLYLVNDCIVTHNSEIIGLLPVIYPKANILISTYRQQVYKTIGERIRKYSLPGIGWAIQGYKNSFNANSISKSRVVVCGNRSVSKVLGYRDDFSIYINDECHLSAADDTFRVISTMVRPKMFGFTGSPDRADGAQFRLLGLFGPTLLEVDMKKAVEKGMVVPVKVYWCPVNLQYDPTANCHSAYVKHRGIWYNTVRNNLIAGAAKLYDENTQVLIIVETIKHAFALKKLLPDYFVASSETPNLDAIRGAFANTKMKKIIATGVFREGVDFKHLGVLINATGIKSSIANIQLTGRVVRTSDGKERGIVHDFADNWSHQFKHFSDERKRLYDKLGYEQLDIQPSSLLIQ